jgi:type I restriction enzyme S subunit
MWGERKALSEVCENLDSRRIPITKKDRKEGSYPYYGASGIVDYVDEYIFDEDLLLVSEDGANLLARTYPIAFSATGKYWVNNHAHVLKFESSISQKFIEYYLNSISLVDFISGMAQPKLNQRALNSIPVPFPPLETQKQIVAKLDQAFADIEKAKANAEQNLKNARELFESYLSQIFSQCDDWKLTTLGELAEISSGGTPRKSTNEFWDGDIAWYSSGELNDMYTQESKEKITNEGLSGSNAKLFPKGSLLIGMYDTAALKMSILDRDGTFNQAIVGVKPNDNINLKFILHSINSIKPELLQQRSGVRQQNLNQAKIKNIPIKLPSIEKQNEVVALLKSISDECDNLSGVYENKLQALDELKQSILQKAFNGELA